MRTALLTALHQELEVGDDLELSGPGPGEVRVRMGASGVGHSDVSFQNGRLPIPLPSIIGQEGTGEIIAVGPEVEGLEVGDDLGKINDAFKAMLAGEVIRTVIEF